MRLASPNAAFLKTLKGAAFFDFAKYERRGFKKQKAALGPALDEFYTIVQALCT